jgi:hypothetical protein
MEIFVDETTRSRIAGEIPSEPLPGLTFKGFSGATPAFRIGEPPSTDVS